MRVDLNSNLEETISHLPGVVREVHQEGSEIGARAESILSSHRDTGAASIETEFSRPDAFVSLVDSTPQKTSALPAVAIEYGHRDKRTGKYVEGLYIITKAAGFA